MKKQVDLGIWRRLTHLVVGLIVLACVLGVFFWYLPVFQKNARYREKILALENDVRTEELKQRQLEAAIRHLRDDPKTVERIAREKLGYARPGETIIYFDAPRNQPVVHP